MTKPGPPAAASWLLKLFLPGHIGPDGLGDYEELYRFRVTEHGRFKANLWYLAQIGTSFPPYILENLTWSAAMFKNYLKIAIRHLVRQKGYSSLNISGLAVGMACCILIALWVKDEMSYDLHHEHAGRIYRVTYAEESGGAYDHYALSPFIASQVFTAELPEVETYTRLLTRTGLIKYQGKKYDETGICYAEPGFFEIFTHTFVAGDADTALSEPGSIVLTEDTALKIFGQESPLGRTLNLNADGDLKVTAVIRNPPRQSHFTFNTLVSFSTIRERAANILDNWLVIAGWSYIRLSPGIDAAEVEQKLAGIVERHTGEEARRNGLKLFYFLQPVPDIHLRSHLGAEIGPQGDIQYVYIFSLIALFILLIACINFMNLSTARSGKRAREVGMRKVFGAQRHRLVAQFMAESVGLSFLGLGGALLLAGLLLPEFNRLTGKAMGLDQIFHGSIWFVFLGLVLLTGLIAGYYPSLILSAFHPVEALRSRSLGRSPRSTLRNILVTLQFAISVVLIIGTLVVLRQVRYMKDQNLGFDREQVLALRARGAAVREQFDALRSRLKQDPAILEASYSDGIPGRVASVYTLFKQGSPETDSHTFNVIHADYDFLRTYGIELASGRDFSRLFSSDENGAFLINETGVKRLGWEDETLGKSIGFSMETLAPIVGVVKDFHFNSLREPIGPLVIKLRSSADSLLSLKLKTERLAGTIAQIKKTWEEFEKDRSFLYFFVDENFDALYHSEERLGRIISLFSGLAIFVACLGLFGLASYTTEQHTKEIGIRRVLGASVGRIVTQLLRSFLKWVLLANLIAWPLAFYVMRQHWLNQFPFKFTLGAPIFLAAGAASLFISLVTVCYHSLRAALANPADTLRVE